MAEHRVQFDDEVTVSNWGDGDIHLSVDDHEHYVSSRVYLTPEQARSIAADLIAHADRLDQKQQ